MATRDYTLGKGKVLFKKSGDAAYLDLGNAPAFTVNTTIEKIEHFSSRSGLSKKDLEVITKLTMAGSFTLDEPNGENLGMFFMSDAGAEAAAQAGGSTAAASIANIVLDRWYPMTLSGTGADTYDAVPLITSESTGTATAAATGTLSAQTIAHQVKILIVSGGTTGDSKISLDGADWGSPIARTTTGTNSVLTVAAGELTGLVVTFDVAANLVVGDIYTMTTYVNGATTISDLTSATVTGKVEGTDFVLDKPAGLFMALSSGTIAANSTVAFATTVYGANSAKTSIKGGTLTSLKGDLYFVGDPPQGRIIDIMGYCSLTPNGDFALIGEDWMQVQFNVEFLQVGDNPEMVKVIDRGKAGSL